MKAIKKEYTAKFYDKRAGDHCDGRITHSIYVGDNKKDAFKEARKELIRLAELKDNCDNQQELAQEIESIKNGLNNFYYDQHTYYFKIFSKKIK